jgi:hypothetical protein
MEKRTPHLQIRVANANDGRANLNTDALFNFHFNPWSDINTLPGCAVPASQVCDEVAISVFENFQVPERNSSVVDLDIALPGTADDRED